MTDPSQNLPEWEGLARAQARDPKGIIVGTNKWTEDFRKDFRARVDYMRSYGVPVEQST